MNIFKEKIMDTRFDTNLLRFFAVIFVVNSHLDSFYPDEFSYLATGGGVGNSLFFFASGYGLYFGLNKLQHMNVMEWTLKRCERIYIPYWGALLLLLPIAVITGDLDVHNVLGNFSNLYYPHQVYWFLRAIIVFYLIIYFTFSIGKHVSNVKVILASIFILVCIYMFSYVFLIDRSIFSIESLPFRLSFYLLCMYLGMFCASFIKRVNVSAVFSLLGLFAAFAIYGISKYLMLKGEAYDFQFMQHVATLMICVFIYTCSHSVYIAKLYSIKYLRVCIEFIANHSLEIYLVHLPIVFLIRYLDVAGSRLIPAVIVVSLIGAYVLKKFSVKLSVLISAKYG